MTTPADTAAPTPTLLDDLRALFLCPRELWLVLLATFIEYLGVFTFLPTLSFWLTSDHHMSDQAAGWWAATFSTVLTLFVFLVGVLADTFGIRRTLVASFSLSAITRLGMALAPSRTFAIIALLAFAFAFATSSPVLQAAVHHASTKRARAFAFSFWYVSFNIAGAISGPIIDRVRHSFLDENHHLLRKTVSLPLLGPHEMSAHTMIMALGFVFATVAALVTLTLRHDFEHLADPDDIPPPKQNPLRALRTVFGSASFGRFMMLMAFLALVKMMFQHMHFTWPKYVTREQGDTFPVGTVWSINSMLILVLAPLGTALTRKRKVFDVLLLGSIISTLSPFILCFGSSMTFQVLAIVMLTIGEALWSPRSYEYAVSIAPRGQESTCAGLAVLPYFVAKFFVGPTSGYLLAMFCPEKGPHHTALLWGTIGAMTILGPIGMLSTRNWMLRRTQMSE